MTKHILYWMIFYKAPGQVNYVQVTYSDGTTRQWRPGETGYESALSRANRYLNHKRR